MDLRAIIALGLLGILGFLFYPHTTGQFSPANNVEWVPIKAALDKEPIREAKLKRDNPVVKTFDLGFIYRIDRTELPFSGTPKDYDILTSKVRSVKEYERAISASATSREYIYPIVTFPPKEARWVQVVVNDWYEMPQIRSARIGARYNRHTPIVSARTKYNQVSSFLLFDGIKFDSAPNWIGGKRIEKEVKKGNETVREVNFEPPDKSGLDITFDLGGLKKVYGISITTSETENNLKQYILSLSLDDQNYQQIYTSSELENKLLTDSHLFNKPIQARYARLTVPPNGWYGKYPEIKEVEIWTDEYRPSNFNEPIENNNASQVYYDDCGTQGNAFAPHLIQGFPYDRGEDSDSQIRYSFKPGDEVDPANPPEDRSFCYHYDSVKFAYDNLDPQSLYWVQVTYLQEKDGRRIQNLIVDGFILHDAMPIPANSAKKFILSIPPEAYQDGKIELSFNRILGLNAVVSNVTLYRASRSAAIPVTYAEGKTGADVYGRATKVNTPIIIDGNIDEWTDIYPLVPQLFGNDPRNSPCQIFVQWDTENLYFAFKANRAKMMKLAESPDFMRSSDTLHLFIDTAFGTSKNSFKANNYHFVFSNLGVSIQDQDRTKDVTVAQIHHFIDSIPRTINNRKEIEMSYKRSDKTSEYILEVRIPKSSVLLDFAPQQKGFIGFNYILSNPYIFERNDDPQKSIIKGFDPLFWSSASKDSAPMFWGKLELFGSVSGQASIMDKNMTKKLSSFNAGDIIVLAVNDPDRNIDKDSAEMITVRVFGDITKDTKDVILYETLPQTGEQVKDETDITIQPHKDSDFFAGRIKTQFGTVPSDDPMVLSVQGKEIVTLEYIDPYYAPKQTNVKVNYTATAKIGTNGSLQILARSGREISQFPAGLRLFFRVQDEDLIRLPEEIQPEPAKITITVSGQDDIEQVTLVDEKNTGVFIGSLDTVYNTKAMPNDNILQVVGKETVTAVYNDLLQATGNTNVKVEAKAIVDVGNDGMLVVGKSETESLNDFIQVNSFNAGENLMIVVKDADLNKDKSSAEQTEVKIEGDQNKDSVTVKLTEIGPDSDTFTGIVRTAYGFKPDKEDDLLEVRGKENIKFVYTDVIQSTGATMVEISQTLIVNIGNDGIVSIVKSNYLWDMDSFSAGDNVYIKLWDPDLNINPKVRDQVEVSIVSEKTLDSEKVKLQEREPDTGIFFGMIRTEYSKEPKTDSLLQVQGGEKVTVLYLDKLRSTGESNVPVTDFCIVDIGTNAKLSVYTKSDPYSAIASFPDEGGKKTFKSNDVLIIKVEDLDVASNTITITATVEKNQGDKLLATLTELSSNDGIFVGEIRAEFAEKANLDDNILQVQGEDNVKITYIDAINDLGQTKVSISADMIVRKGQTGTIEAKRLKDSTQDIKTANIASANLEIINNINIDDQFIVEIRDKDINVNVDEIDWTSVSVKGNLIKDELQVVLQETDKNSGIFRGIVKTAYSKEADIDDDTLQVIEREIITITYIDEVDSVGKCDIPIMTELTVIGKGLCSLLIVDNDMKKLTSFNAGQKIYFRLDDVLLSSMQRNTARISVKSSLTNDSEEIVLDEVPSPGSKRGQGIYIGSIRTEYDTKSNRDGILQIQGGEDVKATYITLYNDPQTRKPIETSDSVKVNKGKTGKLEITSFDGKKIYNFNIGDRLYFKLEDNDLNVNSSNIDTVEIRVSGEAITGTETVKLTETEADSGIFTGNILTCYGRCIITLDSSGNPVDQMPSTIELIGGERVTAIYYDAITETGETNAKIVDTCKANMIGIVTYTSEKITIDGNINEWPLENSLPAGDEGSNIYVQWDEENLYILAYILDSDVSVVDPMKYWENSDAIEIFIDINPMPKSTDKSKHNYYSFWFCPKGGGDNGEAPYVGRSIPDLVWNYGDIEKAVLIFPNRYVMEIKIPFKTALGGFDPYQTSEEDLIGFNYIIYRSDAPKLQWAPKLTEEDLPLSRFGTLMFRK
ncbi:MAG: sugar-binding protein [Candidatus Poribacteria bacterium]